MVRTALASVMLAAVFSVGAALGTPSTAASAAGSCGISGPSNAYAQQVSASTGHARVWRLYQAFFLRQPDADGFNYWVGVRSGGATLGDIAYQFAQGTEFQNRYGNLSHAQFVDLAYNNVLCRAPDAAGRSYWTGLLNSGSLTRWDMIINFAELREYLNRTGTCHSIYAAESAAVPSCPEATLTPLANASLGTNGYREINVAIPGVLGIGVVDGVHVKGSSDRSDRGIFGLRFDASPTNVVEVWPGDTLSPEDTRLNSVMSHNGIHTLESWYAAAETSPYLSVLAPQEIVNNNDWVWAAAGVPLIVDGQVDQDFNADYANDPYTYQTVRHPFVAFDQDTNRLIFGATSNADVRDLVNYFGGAGYEDLIKFDGGGSAEFNIGGQAVVPGTSRDVPVWLGIGC